MQGSEQCVTHVPDSTLGLDTVRRNKQRRNVASANWNVAKQNLSVNMPESHSAENRGGNRTSVQVSIDPHAIQFVHHRTTCPAHYLREHRCGGHAQTVHNGESC